MDLLSSSLAQQTNYAINCDLTKTMRFNWIGSFQ